LTLEFSVVIPTFNRRRVLAEVLAALDTQEEAPPFEIVVVDDGSTDGTFEWLGQRTAGRPLRQLRQQNRGPAAARNRGVEVAAGARIAFLGDDTVPEGDWLARHAARHRQTTTPADGAGVAVLGYTAWHPRMRLTPFLRYINEHGLQFGYALITDPERVPFNFFYTSNLSLAREWLLAEPFDESFPDPAWEDIEASYRLERRGLRLVYEPRARLLHDHPTDFRRFGQRQERAGAAPCVCAQASGARRLPRTRSARPAGAAAPAFPPRAGVPGPGFAVLSGESARNLGRGSSLSLPPGTASRLARRAGRRNGEDRIMTNRNGRKILGMALVATLALSTTALMAQTSGGHGGGSGGSTGSGHRGGGGHSGGGSSHGHGGSGYRGHYRGHSGGYYGGYYGGYIGVGAYGWGYPGYGYYGGSGWYGPPAWGYTSVYPAAGAAYGALDLDVSPEGAQIYVDGNLVGVADDFDGYPNFLWLDKGTYDVVIFAPGFQTIARQYSIYGGLVIDVEDSMVPGKETLPQDLVSKQSVNREERLRRDRENEAEARAYEEAQGRVRGAGFRQWRAKLPPRSGSRRAASPAASSSRSSRATPRSTSTGDSSAPAASLPGCARG
jgi:GT2 family glycosyltransferase